MSPAPSAPAAADADRHTPYWSRVRRLTLLCLLSWFGATFCVIFFARELSAVRFFGWPLSFYMAAQGLTLFYLFIIGVYAMGMHVFDRLRQKEADHGR